MINEFRDIHFNYTKICDIGALNWVPRFSIKYVSPGKFRYKFGIRKLASVLCSIFIYIILL